MAKRNAILVALASAYLATAPAHAGGGLAVIATELRDDGDHDGYADTNETVELWLSVHNTTTSNLIGVSAHIASTSPTLDCLRDDSAAIGNIAAGAQVRAAEPLVFHVGPDVDRGTLGLGVADVLTAVLDLSFTASPVSPEARPAQLVFDIDLNVTAGRPPTTVLEDFEGPGGFGRFSVQNLDLGLHDDANPATGFADGYRCQYNEAECEGPGCGEGDPGLDDCSPGATASDANATWWRVDGPTVPGGGRGFSGTHALYFGQPLGSPLGYTTPLGVLEAARTTLAIPLSIGRWCSTAPSTACTADADCPSGGTCAEVRPTLTFKHQMSVADSRATNVPAGKTADRGVVMAQLSSGGPWIKLDPSVNVHNTTHVTTFSNCSFDPIDDGSTGDDLYPGHSHGGGFTRRGPSSTCAEERVFSWAGSTSGAFDPLQVGGVDGPGLAGASGPGTWVETRYDLSRFAGRNVRIRFLASTIRIFNSATMEAFFQWNPNVVDDGWWIDDFTIEGATATPAPVTVDSTDNSALSPDADDDGLADFCDNCPWIANPSQDDGDDDGLGDACDQCIDGDSDGFGDPGRPENSCPVDNCPLVPNSGQADGDTDSVGDACDSCPATPNPDQANHDGDGLGDACDACTDGDSDGAGDPGYPGNTCASDNCPAAANPGQADGDQDTVGDACDNCPAHANVSQTDGDQDGAGNVCDCAPSNDGTYPGAPEVNDGADNQCPGDVDYGIVDEVSGPLAFYYDSQPRLRVRWTPQPGATLYEYAVKITDHLSASPWCLWGSTDDNELYFDGTDVPSGWVQYLIVRAAEPNRGSFGRGSSGVERHGVLCSDPAP